MKKTLLAAGLAAAFAGSAYAANVSLYGLVDTGLAYSHTEHSGRATSLGNESQFRMENGINAASRFGLKGSESLGDGYSVEFQLENGFDSDTGKLHTDKTLFDREARLSVVTPYGTLSVGRMGALTSGAGTYDVFQSVGDSMDGGYLTSIGAGNWFSRDRYDNMLTYATPDFNGLTGYVQYSFNVAGQEAVGSRDNERYVAVGATYSAGGLNLALVYDSFMYKHYKDGAKWSTADLDDTQTVSFGANYDFGLAKVFFGAQYGKNELLDMGGVADKLIVGDATTLAYDGYNLHIGATAPLFGGDLQVSASYGDYEYVTDDHCTAERFGVAAMYFYPLSKRTTVYAGAGYTQLTNKFDGYAGIDNQAGREKNVDVAFGLTHKF